MKSLHQQTGQPLPLLLYSRSKQELHGDAMGFALFFEAIIIKLFPFLWKSSYLCMTFLYRKHFRLPGCTVRQTKTNSRMFRQRRLLQFTRAVWLAPSDKLTTGPSRDERGEYRGCTIHTTHRIIYQQKSKVIE